MQISLVFIKGPTASIFVGSSPREEKNYALDILDIIPRQTGESPKIRVSYCFHRITKLHSVRFLLASLYIDIYFFFFLQNYRLLIQLYLYEEDKSTSEYWTVAWNGMATSQKIMLPVVISK